MRKIQPTFHRKSIVAIYKSFIRPHLDYGDIVYAWASNELFHSSPESLQYSAAIAITGAIRGTSSEKLFQELGLDTLKWWRCMRKLCLFYKSIKEKSPTYLYQLMQTTISTILQKVFKKVAMFFQDNSKLFKNYFFPAVIMEWNKIGVNIWNL